MVTNYQLLRTVQSLSYRRRLLDGVDELEATIRKYLTEHEVTTTRIGGYDIQAENSQIRLTELPSVDVDQLPLPLYAAHDNKKDESEKLKPAEGGS